MARFFHSFFHLKLNFASLLCIAGQDLPLCVQENSWFTAKSNDSMYCHPQGKRALTGRGCQLPATDEQGAPISGTSGNDGGQGCQEGSHPRDRTGLHSWKLLQRGGERKPAARPCCSLFWPARCQSQQICDSATSGAEPLVNLLSLPARASCKLSDACRVFGKLNNASMLLSEAKALSLSLVLQLNCDLNQYGTMHLSSFLWVMHLARELTYVLNSAFYKTGKIWGEEGGVVNSPLKCLPVQYFGTTSTVLRRKRLKYAKGFITWTKLFIGILKEEYAKT